MNEKEKAFEAAHKAHQAAERELEKRKAELDTAAAEYYQDRFGVEIGVSVIECPSGKIRPSLIIGLRRVAGSIYQWQLAPITKDGNPSKTHRYLTAEAPIKIVGGIGV